MTKRFLPITFHMRYLPQNWKKRNCIKQELEEKEQIKCMVTKDKFGDREERYVTEIPQ